MPVNPCLSRLAALVLAASLAATLGACDMVSGREGASDYVNDTAITTRIKSDLMRTRTMHPLTQIHVTTFKGSVTLSGQVDSQKAADKAIAIARAVPSVVEVKDEMEVRGSNTSSGRVYPGTAQPMPLTGYAPGPSNSAEPAPAAAPVMGYESAPLGGPSVSGYYTRDKDGNYVSPYRDASPGNAGPTR